MPQHLTRYSVLLSSPSDLADERSMVADVIAELNQTWGGPNSAIINLLSWEVCVSPSFGSEAQDVVNRGLGDDWDIYLGMMHARFGTPTKGFGSGTEEEFERAFELWKNEPQRRELMFYFKTAPVDIEFIDTSQLEKVRAFQKSIRDRGGLHSAFRSIDDFAPLLRIHLSNKLTSLHKNSRPTNVGTDVKRAAIDLDVVSTEDEEPGFLDAMEIALRELDALASIIIAMGVLMNESHPFVSAINQEFQAAVASSDLPRMKKAITSLAVHMTELATQLAQRRREYGLSATQAFQSFATAVSIVQQATGRKPEGSVLREKIEECMEMLRQFHRTTLELEVTFAGIPNFAKDFNRSRLLLKTEVKKLADELARSLDLMAKLLLAFEES